jgi:multisubunit Na+/H+ antiporter MnhB subunit
MAEWILDGTLGLLLTLLALTVLFAPTLFTSVVLFIGFGLLVAICWARLGVPDLALAEAAIGSGLMGALLLGALSHMHPEHRHQIRLTLTLPTSLATLLVLALLWRAVWPLQNATTPLPALVTGNLAASGTSHPVTAVLLNFRAWDTLLELMVVCFALLGTRQLRLATLRSATPWPLLYRWSQWLAPLALLIGGYILWRGTHAPGGAFQAGALWAAGAVILRLNSLLPTVSWHQWTLRILVMAGLSLFVAFAAATALWGDGWLTYPPGSVKVWITALEVVATVSIAATLALLVAGEQWDLRP